jgi:predicted anti-sigma-YlaC factor YlaD
MNCRKAQKLFDDRLDGRLDTASGGALDAHLASCPTCHDEWQTYSATWQLLSETKSIEPSFGFVERTMRRLDERAVTHGHEWLPVFRWVALGLTVIALSLGGWLGWQRWNVARTADSNSSGENQELFVQVNYGSFFEDLEVIASLKELPSTKEEARQP